MDQTLPQRLWIFPLLLMRCASSLASVSAQGNKLEICLLPLEAGPCQDLIPRFHYDRSSQKCLEFGYGGCKGNANNFRSQELCERTCGNIQKVPPVCRLELSTYPCDKPNVQYFFNMSTITCEILKPGLCSMTKNVFPDEATCKAFCEPNKIPSYCSSPKDEGLCSANVTRYYFNTRNKACESFIYTGCGGNENNFYYLEDCERACRKASKKSKKRKEGSGYLPGRKPGFWKPLP
ncbi:tissue factor pathway inhibitor 2 [Meriones unguiculatus]|uniref:tissue factor pathway inhibitor 2 n=1 Tax=Meriones unguiculatus TaxID=10047 RepID=UPI000B4F9DCD|nr:tissue factor pathway inhibitor 2 [Meriones unguiculatus]